MARKKDQNSEAKTAESEEKVLSWYKAINSRRVDLVGDYAGSELFFVEFDSLLRHCFTNAKLNFSSKP
jgi:ATP-dependent RNA helicase DDX60